MSSPSKLVIAAKKAASTSSTGDVVYLIEKIVGKRTRNNVKEYFVKWLNYPPEQNTWEPRESFPEDSVDVVDNYEFEHPEAEYPVETLVEKKTQRKCQGSVCNGKKRVSKSPVHKRAKPKAASTVEQLFKVERILDKRTSNEITEYFVKWQGDSLKPNTWEPLENLTESGGLIEEFEMQNQQVENPVQAQPATVRREIVKLIGGTMQPPAGVENHENTIYILVKYTDGEYELLDSKVVGKECPQMLIKFYEDRISFHISS